MLKSLLKFFSSSPAVAAKNGSPSNLPPPAIAARNPSFAEPSATKSGISRDENLVKKLTDDHRVLLAMYGSVLHEADAGKWPVVQQQLHEFQSVLTDHLLLETVKVYSFLKQQHKDDEAVLGSIQDFSSEMNVIRKHVVVTLAGFNDIAVNLEKQKTFREVWRGIGLALGNRIQREEKSLYVLY